MTLLALETSTPLGSIAIGGANGLLAETALGVQATYSETVLDEASRLLDRCGVRARDLAGVVVGAGPGSFTGVRIAASLAKGLCFANDLELFAYSSLRALAASVGAPRVCSLFDARRDEVYVATYRTPTGPAEIGPTVTAIDELLGRLDPAEWAFAGRGALVHEEAIVSAGGRVLPAHLAVVRASALIWLATEDPEGGRVADRGVWEPEYVRASGAERGVGAGSGRGGRSV